MNRSNLEKILSQPFQHAHFYHQYIHTNGDWSFRYYESPPGLQLLHALRFDESVVGGESTFMDSHAIANELRHRDPEAFHVLTRVPATFQKGKIHCLYLFFGDLFAFPLCEMCG